MSHTTWVGGQETGSPFQNTWQAHVLHCWLWACFILSFLFGLSEMGHADFLGKYLERSQPHSCFLTALVGVLTALYGCQSLFMFLWFLPQSGRSTGWGWLFLSCGWGNWSSALLRDLGRVSDREGAILWNSFPSCSLPIYPSHLGEPWEISDYAIALLIIFPFITLILRIMPTFLSMLTGSFAIWPCSPL